MSKHNDALSAVFNAYGIPSRVLEVSPDGIISVIPFNCMPGLIVDGFIPKFRKDNNNIPFVSIEYDGFQDSTREMKINTFVAQVKERYENKKYLKSE